MTLNGKQTPSSHFRSCIPLLLILFGASGCTALIYEIVWYQLLQLVIGASTVSLAVLLATFMGGLSLGSIALPSIIGWRKHHPLRVYAVIELSIGICSILVLFGMPLINRIYVTGVGHGLSAILLRGIICSICLLMPTMLMGASLPAVARWIEATRQGASWLGLLYGANTAGAVLGSLLAGFYLLRVFDTATATYAAAATNALVALASFYLSLRTSNHPEESPRQPQSSSARQLWPIYAAVASSGACALGAEVVWTRLLGLILGSTVYTFSIVLAVFLAGLALGAGAGSLLACIVRIQTAIGYCQLLLTAAVAWTAFALAKSIPYWPVNPKLSVNPWFNFQIDIGRAVWAILPPTILWGMTFALALVAVASRGYDPARAVATVYVANMAGAISGALSFSMLLIPRIGTQQCERALISLSGLSALCLLTPADWFSAKRLRARVLWLLASAALTGLLARGVPAFPAEVVAYGRLAALAGNVQIVYVGEGLNSSIAISKFGNTLQFHVNGKVEASNLPYDMRLQRMLGHLPALLHPHPRSALVIGFGSGVTAGSFVVNPDVQRIVVCEIEPLVPPIATRYFGRQNYNVLHDRRTEMIYDDARNYILTTPEKFDVITSDPIHPWVKGSATLYTKEYFELVKQHLNPRGVVAQWVPLYETDVDTVKSEIATFLDVFPHGTIWGNQADGEGYDIVLLGQTAEAKINVDELQNRLDSPEYAGVVKSLREVGLDSAFKILASYAGQRSDLDAWLSDAKINLDGNLRLQYLAGLALNSHREGPIYNEILRYRRFPVNVIVGSEEYVQSFLLQHGRE